jgi:hypothetical protein
MAHTKPPVDLVLISTINTARIAGTPNKELEAKANALYIVQITTTSQILLEPGRTTL